MQAVGGSRALILSRQFPTISRASFLAVAAASVMWAQSGQTLTKLLTLSPTSLTFPTTFVGSTSAEQIETITSAGTGAVTISSLALMGANPGDFSITGCPAVLNPGSSCTVRVAFKPTAAGARAGTLTVVSDGTGSPQTVTLTGTAQTPVKTLTVNPTSLSFGTQNTGTTSAGQAVTITSTGNTPVAISSIAKGGVNPLQFSITGNNCPSTLSPGSHCQVTIAFAPTSDGAKSATLVVTSNGTGSPQTVTFAGTAQTPVRTLTLNPASLSFGTQNTGTTSAGQAVTITSTGNTPVAISSIAKGGVNPLQFSITGNNCPSTLSPGSHCQVTIAFAPTSDGAQNATLVVTSDGTGSPQSVPLTGVGHAVTRTLTPNPPSLTFAAQNVGSTSTAQNVTISSSGNTAVTITGLTLTGANSGDYAISANNCPSSPVSLAAGSSCSISLTFTPSAAGARSANLSIASNATGSPLAIPLSGTGQTPKILSFSPLSRNFGNVTLGNSAGPLTFSITSTGTAGVTFSGFTLSGTNPANYHVTNSSCPLSPAKLNPGISCAVNVMFTPTAAGTRVAVLNVASDAIGSPKALTLTGIGQPPATTVNISPTSLTFTGQNVGSVSSSHNFTITNTGNNPAQFNIFTLTGANASDFAISFNNCPVPPASMPAGQSCTVGISFTPSAAGSRNASVVIVDNAVGTPQGVVLAGAGQDVTKILTLSPTSVTFPNQNVGSTSASHPTVSISSTGTSPVTISNIGWTGANAADFAIVGNTCPQVLSGACTITLSFTPSASGTRNANLTIASNGMGSPQTIPISGIGQPPSKTLFYSAITIGFSATTVGSTTAQQGFYMTNTGTQPVTFSSFAISGSNAADFKLGPGTQCQASPATLAPGSSCYLYVTFTPSAIGARSANLTVTSDASPASRVITLSGLGSTSAELTVAPTMLTFAPQNQGTQSAAQNVNLYNNTGSGITLTSFTLGGSNAGDFVISGNTCSPSLAGGANCAVSVKFKPTATGARTATLTITHSASGSPSVVTLNGTGQSTTQILNVLPTGLAFVSQNVNSTSAAQNVQLYNAGTGTITFGGFALGGTNAADFAISSNSCPVAPAQLGAGGYCYVYVTFTPTATGARSASLTIHHSATGGTFTVALNGTGRAVTRNLNLVYTSIDFTTPQVVGITSGSLYETIYNAGTDAVAISVPTISGTNAADFAITNNGCPVAPATLGPAGYCYVYVAFTPAAVGSRTAMLSITSNAAGSPQNIPMRGIGRTSNESISLSQNSLTFGAQLLHTTSGNLYFYIYNVGTAPITLTGFTLTGTHKNDFAVYGNNCPVSPQQLAPTGSCYVYINFTPSAIDLRKASMEITSDAPGSPHSVSLYGTGVATTQILNVSYSNLSFAPQEVGTTSPPTSYYFYIYNTGTSPVTLTSLNITGTNSGDFAKGSTTCPVSPASLGAGGNCYLYVTFTPSAIGPRAAQVEVVSSAPGSPDIVTLNGIGRTPTKIISLSPSGISFGPTNTGVTTSGTANYYYVYNTGTAPLTIASMTVGGTNAADFAIPSTTCPAAPATLGAGGNCYAYVTFSPHGIGPRTGTITIANDAVGAHVVTLNGIGQSPTMSLESAPNFLVYAPRTIGTTSPASYIGIVNQGTAAVTISSVSLTGTNASDFAITSQQCPIGPSTVAPGGVCYVYITFTPSAAGDRIASLSVVSNAAGSPDAVPILGRGNGTSAILYTSNSALSFGQTTLNTASGAQQVNLYNAGNATANLSGMTIGGANVGDFAITLNNCPLTLNAGAGCSLQVTFTPTVVGTRAASLNIANNTSTPTVAVGLTGIGRAVTNNTLTFNSTSLSFPTVTIGTSSGALGFTIYNYGTVAISISGITLTGTNPGDFGITSNNCTSTLDPNVGCTVQVTFSPTQIGARSANVQVASSATGSPQTVSAFGTGQAQTQQFSVNYSTLTFPSTNVGTTSGQVGVSMYNYGTTAMTINSVTLVGANNADFSIVSNSCPSSLAAAQNCTVYVTFHPSAIGARVAQMQISDSAPGHPHFVDLSGTGRSVTSTLTLSNTTLAFGLQILDTPSTAHGVSLYDYGNAPLSLSAFSIGGINATDFTISNNNCSSTLGAGVGCTVSIVFQPSALGLRKGTLTIASSAADSPVVVSLIGDGEAATRTVTFYYSSFTFAPQNLSTTSSPQSASLYNFGSVPVTLSGFAIAGANSSEFSITSNNCPSILNPGAGCTANIAFTPSAVGARSASLRVTSDAPGSPTTVSLFGTGQSATQILNLSESSMNFGNQAVNTSGSAQYFYLYNQGTSAITLNSFTVGGTNGSDFTITQNICTSTIAPGANCYVYLRFTPAAAGPRVGNLSISSTAPGSPTTLSLYGNGQ